MRKCILIVEDDIQIVRNLDHTALQRIFHNILINASIYSDGDLVAVLSENGEICFHNHAQNLSKVETERLFYRFHTVRNVKGSTGLGLSIAKPLCEQMGGSIRRYMKMEYCRSDFCFLKQKCETHINKVL